MSRLTASPFHKPSAFESIARAPPSPPDTLLQDSSFSTATVARGLENHHHHLETEAAPSVARGLDGLPDADSSLTMSPAARFRKVSTMAYMNSGLREARERTIHRPASKSFVIVIPPAAFQHEHGALGHTLSSGPAHRHSQGLLMPLFPTFYAQVTAIAKEWNFPSTSGICLYLQYTDNGFTTSPRVSDDTWQFLWSHVLDPNAPVSASRPPIVGKLEFDLDMRLARWYSSWLSSAQRDPYELGAPSLAPSEQHFRNDSRTTMQEDEIPDDRSVITRISHRPGRHIPRKLSLVDRVDAAALRKSTVRPPTPPEPTAVPVHPLSPITQLEEPKSALASKVMSWRASAGGQSSLLASNGQASLDPVHMPNSVPLESPRKIEDEQEEEEEEELNLADFEWSISSAGPRSYIEDFEDDDSYYLPSVHMDRRAQGSVCLTASVCTSFGPLDDDWLSDVSSISRLPSPDIALRMLEDCPVSPSVCTSNPDFDWPPSPSAYSRANSVDLGERGVFSRPCTPSTATSWGAPLSYPPSPVTPFYVATPDAGQRAFDPTDVEQPPRIWSWPYYQPWEGTVWNHVWPYTAYRDGFAPSQPVNPPTQTQSSSRPYAGYPTFSDLYPAVYPKNLESKRLYPSPAAPVSSRLVNVEVGSAYPHFEIYKAVWPHNLSRLYPAIQQPISRAIIVTIGSGYPTFDLYPAKAKVSPYNWPHWKPTEAPTATIVPASGTLPVPAKISTNLVHASPIKVSISRGYPCFELYAAPYPRNLSRIYTPLQKPIYPMFHVEISRPYPYLEIYKPQYPHSLNRIYPSVQQGVSKYVEVSIVKGYPEFQLYPVPANKRGFGWPYFQPKVENISVPVTPRQAAPKVIRQEGKPSSLKVVRAGADYPIFDLYPAPYPANLSRIYLPLAASTLRGPVPIKIGRGYPYMEIYPAGYPASVYNIYLPVQKAVYPFVEVEIAHGYPNFILYAPPPVVSEFNWPHWTPSSSVKVSTLNWPHWKPTLSTSVPVVPPKVLKAPVQRASKVLDTRPVVNVRLGAQYPHFVLYAPVYPHNLRNIYPECVKATPANSGINVRVLAKYPNFQLYPPVYPHNLVSSSIYPPPHGTLVIGGPKPVSKSQYPHFKLYPAGYPHNLQEIYLPSVQRFGGSEQLSSSHARYPFFVLYPPVYPAIELYPSIKPKMAAKRIQRTHTDLYVEVFPKGVRQVAKRARRSHLELYREALVELPPLQTSSTRSSASAQRRLSSLDASLGPRLPPPSSPLPRPPSNLSPMRAPLGPRVPPPTSALPPRPADLSPIQAPLGPRLSSPTTSPIQRRTLSSGKPLTPIQTSAGTSPVATKLTHVPSPTSARHTEGLPPAPNAPRRTLSLRNRFTEQTQPPLSRSASVANAPPSAPLGHKKRDSLVLQRVKAFNSIDQQPPAPPAIKHTRTPSYASRMPSHSRTPSIAENL